jgi:hypothetical protein
VNFLEDRAPEQVDNSIDPEDVRKSLIAEVKARGFLRLPEEEAAFLKAEQRIAGQNRRNATSAVTSGFTGLFSGAVSGFLGTFKAQWDKYGDAFADKVLDGKDANRLTAFSQERALRNLEKNDGGIENVSRFTANAAFANNYVGAFFQRQIRKAAGLVGSLVGLASCAFVAPYNFFAKGIEQSTTNYNTHRKKIVQFDDVTRQALNKTLSGKTGKDNLVFVPINNGESVAKAIARRRREIEDAKRTQKIADESAAEASKPKAVSKDPTFELMVAGGQEVPAALNGYLTKAESKEGKTSYDLNETTGLVAVVHASKYGADKAAWDVLMFGMQDAKALQTLVFKRVVSFETDCDKIKENATQFDKYAALGDAIKKVLPSYLASKLDTDTQKALFVGTLGKEMKASLETMAKGLGIEGDYEVIASKALAASMIKEKQASGVTLVNATINHVGLDHKDGDTLADKTRVDFANNVMKMAELKNPDINKDVIKALLENKEKAFELAS